MKNIRTKTRKATPVTKALKYIMTCVMYEIAPLPETFLNSLIYLMAQQAWQKKEAIGRSHIFKGIISSKWARAQDL